MYCSRRWALCTTENTLPDINGPYGYAHVGMMKDHETGQPNCVCRHCHAWLFPNVKHHSGTNIGENSGSVVNPQSGICCNRGKVDLPPVAVMPTTLHRLWSSQDVDALEFRAHARGYNSAFMMASTSAKVTCVGFVSYLLHFCLYQTSTLNCFFVYSVSTSNC